MISAQLFLILSWFLIISGCGTMLLALFLFFNLKHKRKDDIYSITGIFVIGFIIAGLPTLNFILK